MKKLFTVAMVLLVGHAFGQIESPEKFLGYKLGDRFTRHHKMIDYYEHVAEKSEMVQLSEYGRTNEQRPLVTAIISTKENLNNLESIRKNNLALASGKGGTAGTAIVWLSYNVHGNEASSLDASLKTLYNLVNSPEALDWLQNTVVILDPCINPDGRERYVNNYYETTAIEPNPSGDAKEHHEPWPGGRANHYLFDLNRDWAWQTQVESKQRMQLYNQWMPHVHVDFHEQGYNNPYYFAPAAQPYHDVITPWQRKFQVDIGKNHAKYFDKNNWLYFTKEVFDLFYPSYGDSYPLYNGAIGMTYEQAGHGFAGLAIQTNDNDTLTLKDRLTHHYTSGMSTIEIASKNADQLSSEFGQYFKEGNDSGYGSYKTFVIKKENNTDKLQQLTRWLDSQDIHYGTVASSNKSAAAFDYLSNKNTSVSVNKGDLVISTYQPKARLISVLFEPKSNLVDSLTYDITSWSIPYVYGLKAYAFKNKINASAAFEIEKTAFPEFNSNAYAYIFKYKHLQDAKLLAHLLKNGLTIKVADAQFTAQGQTFASGSIVVTRKSNAHLGQTFENTIKTAAKKFNRPVFAATTGFMDQGYDFGSAHHKVVTKPKVMLVGGDGTSSLNYGAIWHYFEKELQYPVTNVYTDYFNRVDLSSYDVIVLPSGRYNSFNKSTMGKIKEWTQKGGNLVLLGSAISKFKGEDGFNLKSYNSPEEKKEFEKRKKSFDQQDQLAPYNLRNRNYIQSSITGAIYKVTVDNTHPLAYGYDKTYFTLKQGTSRLAYLENGANVGVIKSSEDHVAGFVGNRVRQSPIKTVVFGVSNTGRGHVTYFVDDPLFRDFWENGKLMFANSIFFLN